MNGSPSKILLPLLFRPLLKVVIFILNNCTIFISTEFIHKAKIMAPSTFANSISYNPFHIIDIVKYTNIRPCPSLFDQCHKLKSVVLIIVNALFFWSWACFECENQSKPFYYFYATFYVCAIGWYLGAPIFGSIPDAHLCIWGRLDHSFRCLWL